MDSPAWAKRIDTANSMEDVLALLRDYVATRDSRDLALLPPDCLPVMEKKPSPEEIADCAYRCAAYHGDDDAAVVIARIGGVLSRAAVRLAELAHH